MKLFMTLFYLFMIQESFASEKGNGGNVAICFDNDTELVQKIKTPVDSGGYGNQIPDSAIEKITYIEPLDLIEMRGAAEFQKKTLFKAFPEEVESEIDFLKRFAHRFDAQLYSIGSTLRSKIRAFEEGSIKYAKGINYTNDIGSFGYLDPEKCLIATVIKQEHTKDVRDKLIPHLKIDKRLWELLSNPDLSPSGAYAKKILFIHELFYFWGKTQEPKFYVTSEPVRNVLSALLFNEISTKEALDTLLHYKLISKTEYRYDASTEKYMLDRFLPELTQKISNKIKPFSNTWEILTVTRSYWGGQTNYPQKMVNLALEGYKYNYGQNRVEFIFDTIAKRPSTPSNPHEVQWRDTDYWQNVIILLPIQGFLELKNKPIIKRQIMAELNPEMKHLAAEFQTLKEREANIHNILSTQCLEKRARKNRKHAVCIKKLRKKQKAEYEKRLEVTKADIKAIDAQIREKADAYFEQAEVDLKRIEKEIQEEMNGSIQQSLFKAEHKAFMKQVVQDYIEQIFHNDFTVFKKRNKSGLVWGYEIGYELKNHEDGTRNTIIDLDAPLGMR